MSRLFAFKLLERVAITFGLAFAATYSAYILGGFAALNGVTDLTIGHKALIAGIAAAVQLALSTLVAPHVGDPNSPDLVPGFILKRLHKEDSTPQSPAPAVPVSAAVSSSVPLTTNVDTSSVNAGEASEVKIRTTPAAPHSDPLP